MRIVPIVHPSLPRHLEPETFTLRRNNEKNTVIIKRRKDEIETLRWQVNRQILEKEKLLHDLEAQKVTLV